MQEKNIAWGRVKNCMRELTAYGNARKAQIGADKVYDFSLGCPSAPVPEAVWQSLREALKLPEVHERPPITGLAALRTAVAEDLNARYALGLASEDVLIVTGAAGGLAVCANALLDKGDEAVVFVPYFTEYRVFLEGAGASVVEVPPLADMQPDLDALEKAVTERTRLVLVNTPNNPSGAILSEESQRRLASILREASERYGRPIYLLSDEPYRELCFDMPAIPCVMRAYEDAILCYSFSKSLSLPGERIGYLAVHPALSGKEEVFASLVKSAAALGYSGAPSLLQHALIPCVGMTADIAIYRRNRDLLYGMLTELGFSCVSPEGAFYLFMKAPIEDAKAFSEAARKYELLLVPSDDFGLPGYLRLAYCVPTETIEGSREAFRALAREFGLTA